MRQNGNAPLFTDNGDGTVTIDYLGPAGEKITLDLGLEFGVNQAHLTWDRDDQGNVEVWVQLIEKAYREYEGWDEFSDGGSSGFVMQWISGEAPEDIAVQGMTQAQIDGKIDDIQAALDANRPITFNVKDGISDVHLASGGVLWGWHAYAATGYDDMGFTLHNPHGENHVYILYDEITPDRFSHIFILE